MKIWLDTIDCEAIADGVNTGILFGVTTNPSILSTTQNVRQTLSKILDLQPGPVAVQVTSTDPEEMVDEGMRIFEFSSRIIIKVPVNRNGLIAIKKLKEHHIPIMGTAVLFPAQVLLASTLEVPYIAPYFSHMGDFIEASATLKKMQEILLANHSSTNILAASLKQIDHILYCASLGIEAITIKPDLYYKLIAEHPLIEGFIQKFQSDWNRTHGQISIKEALQNAKNRV